MISEIILRMSVGNVQENTVFDNAVKCFFENNYF